MVPIKNKDLFFLTVIIVLISLLAYFGSDVNPQLRYSRSEIFDGQVWRIITAHLVHLNFIHSVMNLGALVLIMLIVGSQFSVNRWAFSGFFSAFFISVCLLTFSDNIDWYVGLSGVLHGFIVMGLANSIAEHKDKLHGVALIFVAIKIIREQLPGFDTYHLLPYIEAAVVVDAHMYGAISGLVLAAIFIFMNRSAKLLTI